MVPDIKLLSIYMVVSNSSSMRAAAARLGITPAAVSQSIARIEKRIGVPLLERGARGVRLTTAGTVLRQHASIVLQAADDLVDALEPFKTSAVPRMRMYVLESAARALFPTLIRSLSDIVGDLAILSSRRYNAEELVGGVWDLLIATDDLSHLPNIQSYPIFKERLVALVPKQMLEEESRIEVLSRRLPYLRNNRPRRLYEMTDRFIANAGIHPLRNIDCPSTGAMVDLVAAGLGWAISTPLMLCRLRPPSETVAWLVLPDAYHRSIYLTVERNRFMDLPVTLAETCRATLRDEIATWPEKLSPAALEAVEVLGDPKAERPRALIPDVAL